MRDPIERSVSQYRFHVRFWGEKRDMETAIRQDRRYTDPSNYAMQLASYIRLFGADNIATLTFEELSKDTLPVMQKLFHWLGVDPSFNPPNFDQRENVTPQIIVVPKTGAAEPRGPRVEATDTISGVLSGKTPTTSL
jgi:hypothetical protein